MTKVTIEIKASEMVVTVTGSSLPIDWERIRYMPPELLPPDRQLARTCKLVQGGVETADPDWAQQPIDQELAIVMETMEVAAGQVMRVLAAIERYKPPAPKSVAQVSDVNVDDQMVPDEE